MINCCELLLKYCVRVCCAWTTVPCAVSERRATLTWGTIRDSIADVMHIRTIATPAPACNKDAQGPRPFPGYKIADTPLSHLRAPYTIQGNCGATASLSCICMYFICNHPIQHFSYELTEEIKPAARLVLPTKRGIGFLSSFPEEREGACCRFHTGRMLRTSVLRAVCC